METPVIWDTYYNVIVMEPEMGEEYFVFWI